MDAGPDFGSDFVLSVKNKNIMMLSGEDVSSNALGAIWHFFERELEYSIKIVDEKMIRSVDLSQIDVIIMPAGYFSILNDKSSSDYLYNWISKGGRLIALDAAVSALSKTEWGLKIKKGDDDNDKKDIYEPLKVYEKRERDYLKNITPGSIYVVDLDTTHPLAFGYNDRFFTLKQNDLIYDFITSNGWNVGVIKQSAQKAGFVGTKLKSKLKDGLVFGVQSLGAGSVVSFADDIIFRSFWENGKLMLCNAVFFQF